MYYTDEKTIHFIQQNLTADTQKLVLSAKRYTEIADMHYVVEQIQRRNQIKTKLPHYFANAEIIIPSRIAAEQCSSEQTALYKQQLLKGQTLCDLTGGFGADSYYFALKTTQSIYIERFEEYCEAAKHNFKALGIQHIDIIQGDAREIELPRVDTFYVDPARRGDANKRIFSVVDCEPNVVLLKDKLLQKGQRVIVKLSPMADISQTLRLLPETMQVHILSVKNECKELLFILEKAPQVPTSKVPIVCINFTTKGELQHFSFTFSDEQDCIPNYVPNVLNNTQYYLYEPNASIMKAGGFKTIARDFAIQKVHPNSHLYLSDQFIPSFPGRVFLIDQCIDFQSKAIKTIHKQLKKANIATRNFPLTPDLLRKKLKIADGGECYLFATTWNDGQKKLILTHKV